MRLFCYRLVVALLSVGLLSASASAARKPNIKERGTISSEVLFEPTAEAPTGMTASAKLSTVKQHDKRAGTSTLVLTTSGFSEGNYGVDAFLKDDFTPVHLGNFMVGPISVVDPAPDSPVTFILPSTVDATLIESLSITDSSGTVIAEGVAIAASVTWKYFANVRVTGDPVLSFRSGKGHTKRAFGHVVAKSTITNDVETKRQFLWVSFGAPADTELTINVDDVAVGTVMSTGHGKVMFHQLADTVVLRDMQLITLTDSMGAIVTQAEFQITQ